jgi:general secretion pathway protein A
MTIPHVDYFHLNDEPFSTSPNPRFLYVSPTHNIALEKTRWTIAARRGLAICFGMVGTGKTTLVRELVSRLEDDKAVSYVAITNPNFPTANQLLRAIIQEFAVGQTSKNYLELLNIFKNYLAEQALKHNKNLVLLIDEAQTLKPPLLEMLRQLMNFESNDQKFLQVVLFAQEEFRKRLQHPRYANLVNRVAMSASIEALSLNETGAMLKHRWMIAGGKDDFPFTNDAIEQLFIYSKGIPRTQIILADNSLLAAYLLQKRTIDAGLLHQVVKDRGLPDTQLEPEPQSIKRNVRQEGGKK